MDNKKIIILLYFSLIIIIAIVLRIYKLGSYNFAGDEAKLVIRSVWLLKGLKGLLNFDLSRENLFSFYGIFAHTHPPIELLFPLPFLLFGVNEWLVRLPYALLGIISIIFCYHFVKKEISANFALLSLPIFAWSSIMVGYSRDITYSFIHILLSGVLVFTLIKYAKKPNKHSFNLLMIITGLCLLTHVDFIAVLPLVIYVIFQKISRLKFNQITKGFLILFLTAGIFYLVWIILSFTYLYGYLGARYMLFYKTKHIGNLLSTIIYLIKNFIFDFNILPWIFFSLLALKKINKSITVKILSLFCLSYLIYFLLIRNSLPYMFNIYLPLVFLGLIGLKQIKKSYSYIFLSLFGLFSLITTIYFLIGGRYPTNLNWPFLSEKSNTNKIIGYLVRHCTSSSDKYIAISGDNWAHDYYFNRRYPIEFDQKGIDYALNNHETGVNVLLFSKSYINTHRDYVKQLTKGYNYQKSFADGQTLF